MPALESHADDTGSIIRDVDIYLRNQRISRRRRLAELAKCDIRENKDQVFRNQLHILVTRFRILELMGSPPGQFRPEASGGLQMATEKSHPGSEERELVASYAQMGERCRGIILFEGEHWPRNIALWTCDHRHATPAEATACAEQELLYRNAA
jgi:hypothetical protein